MAARKYHQGKFIPRNPLKYIGDRSDICFRSSWERKFMAWCDSNPSVISWNSESIIVPYYSNADGKWRRYFVDFAIKVKLADGTTKTMLIEIKPESQVLPPKQSSRRKPATVAHELYEWQVNQDKWSSADKFAKENGAEFKVLTEYDLGIARR